MAESPTQHLESLKKLSESMTPENKAVFDHAVKSIMDSADSDGDGKPDAAGIKAWFYKNGQFSKTAGFATLGNFFVLFNYMLQTWLQGANVDLGFLKFTVSAFNAADAAAIIGILNATYLGNNFLSKKNAAAPQG